MNEVTLILTPPEVLLFKDFQQYHDTFTLLVNKGVFNITSGNVTIHFDDKGSIQRIERKDDLYNKRNT